MKKTCRRPKARNFYWLLPIASVAVLVTSLVGGIIAHDGIIHSLAVLTPAFGLGWVVIAIVAVTAEMRATKQLRERESKE